MTDRRPAVHRTILVVDVEGFGRWHRTNAHQVAIRDGMYRSLKRAFEAADIPWSACHVEDRGDGVFVLAPPDVPKGRFAEVLPPALAEALHDHNSGCLEQERIRLRMALHAGEINYDDYGVAAASINLAFRLLDAPALKDALAESPGVLALIASSWFFDEVIRHSRSEDPSTYRQVAVTVKETTTTAWISLPDHPYAAGAAAPEKSPPRLADPADKDVASRGAGHVAMPQQLPPQPRFFTGRTNELALLTKSNEAEAETCDVLVISGLGGIGKTWLGLQWAHQNLHRFPDGQLYVDLQGFDPSGSPLTPAVGLRNLLDALHVDPRSIPVDLNAQAALYRSLVADRRMLILLDNARDSAQIVPLLPGSPTCTVLVTSRRQLTGLVTAHGARHLTLDALDDADARRLLIARLGADRILAESNAADDLLRWCAGLPLALGIVAAHAAIHPEFSLAALSSELSQASARLDALDGGELSTNLRAVLSWSYQMLDGEVADVFHLLGVAPGPDIGLNAAAALVGLRLARTAALLRELENACLVQQYAPGRYRMHDLVRLYATECTDARGSARAGSEALRRLIDFYVHTSHAAERQLYPHRKPIDVGDPLTGFAALTFKDDGAILDWLHAEHPCLLAAQAAAARQGWHTWVWQLAWTLHGYLWRRGHILDQLATWRMGLAAAQTLGDQTVQALAHRLLGQALARAKMHSDASNHLRHAIDLAHASGDVHGEARAHYDLAGVWRSVDDQQALVHASHALRLFQTLDNPVWEAEALSAMGWYQARLGLHQHALASCEQALALFVRNGNRQGQATTLDCLGYIAHHLGRHGAALAYYHESLALCRGLGATYDEADTLDHLGQAHAALGQRSEARDVWREALSLNRAQHRLADVHRIECQLAELDGDPRGDRRQRTP